jgi:hypothetical protein
MGDRYFWDENCPKCKKKNSVECYDAPSCYQFSRRCRECNWTDGLEYYETSPHTIELLTEKQAKEKGVFYVSGLEAELSRDKKTGKVPNLRKI